MRMKQSIDHLPEIKQRELENIISVICNNCVDVEKIILFGSYAKGNYKEAKDLKLDRKSGHISDFDILVVTAKKEVALDSMLWKRISGLFKELNLSARPMVITHDIEELNIKLAKGQYFYSDIKKDGILLYDTKKYQLVGKRDLTVKENQRIAQDYFDHWFEIAKMFFGDFKSDFRKSTKNKKYLSKAAFDLHQATEHSYKTILLVFTNYNPAEHFLENLSDDAKKFDPRLQDLFPQNNKEEEERFELLEYAYIAARYDPQYFICKEDLEILAMDVEKLLDITKEICKKKIASFVKES